MNLTAIPGGGLRGLSIGLLLVALPCATGFAAVDSQDVAVRAVREQAAGDLQVLGLWRDRSVALQSVLLNDDFREQRSVCWGVGANLEEGLQGRVNKSAEALEQGIQTLQGKATALIEALERSSVDESTRKGFDVAREGIEDLVVTQEALESEVLRPLPVSPGLVREIVVDAFGEKQRTGYCGRMAKQWEDALAQARHQPEFAKQTAAENERMRRDFQREALLADVFASNNSGLPSVMTESTGVAERMGGTDGLAISLMTALGEDAETVGTQALATVRIPFQTPNPRMGISHPWRSSGLLLRLQVPLERTFPDSTGLLEQPQGGATARRYAFTLGWDLSDQTDPRHLSPARCLRSMEALTPLPAVLDEEARAREVGNRRPLYEQCAEQALRDVRWGLRLSGQWLETRNGEARTVEPGALAFGFVLARGNVSAQLLWRRTFEPRVITGYTLALHANTGIGPSALSLERRVALGLDMTATFQNLHGDDQFGSFEGLIAPSLLVRLGRDVFGTLSAGYLSSTRRSGMLFRLGLTWDADRIVSSP